MTVAPANPVTDARNRKLRDGMGMGLILIVLLAPLPMGSNRPMLWILWAVVLGLVLTTYLFLHSPNSRPLRLFRYPWVLVCGLCVPVFAFAQILPLASVLPEHLTHLPLPEAFNPKTISLTPAATRLGILRACSYAALFVLFLDVGTSAYRVNHMRRALFFGLTLHAVWAMASLTLWGDQFPWGAKTAYAGMATGTFVNRNAFATFMGMTLVLGLSLLPQGQRRRSHDGTRCAARVGEGALIWICLAIVFLALIATQSRLGIVSSLLAALVCISLRVGIASQNRLYFRLNWLSFGAGLALFLGLLLRAGVMERSVFIWQDAESRIALYRQILAMISDRPLLGYGFDAFGPAFQIFHRPPVSSDLTWEYAHSTYLVVWVELGLIAGSMPLLALGLTLRHLIRRSRYPGPSQAPVIAAIAALVLGGVHSLFDFSLEIEANAFLFITLLAMGLAPYRAAAPKAFGEDNQRLLVHGMTHE